MSKDLDSICLRGLIGVTLVSIVFDVNEVAVHRLRSKIRKAEREPRAKTLPP